MLSRTAGGLYWLARYMERAENTARIVMAGHRMASIARSLGNAGNEWHSTLLATGSEAGFAARHPEPTADAVITYLVSDPDNSSSIFSCLETARRNARSVRTALTVDMWDTLNETWYQARQGDRFNGGLGDLLGVMEWVKERSLLFNGAYANTMLRNDAYYFTRLGTFIERADNTARILDVKYHVLLPRGEDVGGALDYYHWQAILRSVSGLRAYHWVYQDRLKPWLVAELMMLRPEMPRSLLNCYNQIVDQLDMLADAYGGKRGDCHRTAGELHSRLRFGLIQRIFQSGLHEFLTDFIDQSASLGREINALYMT